MLEKTSELVVIRCDILGHGITNLSKEILLRNNYDLRSLLLKCDFNAGRLSAHLIQLTGLGIIMRQSEYFPKIRRGACGKIGIYLSKPKFSIYINYATDFAVGRTSQAGYSEVMSVGLAN